VSDEPTAKLLSMTVLPSATTALKDDLLLIDPPDDAIDAVKQPARSQGGRSNLGLEVGYGLGWSHFQLQHERLPRK
jgi:hypothetical protein